MFKSPLMVSNKSLFFYPTDRIEKYRIVHNLKNHERVELHVPTAKTLR